MSVFSAARKTCTGWLRAVFGLKRYGEENIPEKGPFIVCSNHRSNFDPVILGISLNNDLSFMAKAELFKVPVLKSIIKSFGAFPVKRGKNDKESIVYAMNLLKEGKILAMFPEGTRSKEYGEPLRFKGGAALAAFKSKAPVLPAAICTKGHVRLFKRNIFKIGKPLSYEELGFTTGDSKDLREASALIREKVIELMKSEEN